MASELKMLIEFLRLSSEDGKEEFEYVEENEPGSKKFLLEQPIGFLKKFFGLGKKSKDGAPKATPAQASPETPEKAWAAVWEPEKSKPAPPKEKWVSAGCVVFDSLKDMNRVYVIQQKNWNSWAFPKGRVDGGDSIKKTAIREVAEETGLTVSLLPSGYLGKGVGGFSITHFFAAVRTGGSPSHDDKEVSKVKLVSFTEAYKLFKHSGGSAGRRDLMILRRAWEYANKYKKGKVPDWPE